MSKFFHGWRKRVGLFTLALACLFAIGWVRSFIVKDRIDFSRLAGPKKNNSLAGLATDRQSLVLLVYKVDEIALNVGQNAVIDVSTEGEIDIQIAENQPITNVEELKNQPLLLGTQLPTNGLQPGQPVIQTNFVSDDATSAVATNASYTPLPSAMISSPPDMLSIHSDPLDPSKSKLIATNRVPLVSIPYWSIVTPLTLLSAWLLLSTPRVKKAETSFAN